MGFSTFSNLKLSILLVSQSKDRSVREVYGECAKCNLSKWDLYLHEKLVLNEEKLKYYHYSDVATVGVL